ncbi:LacI family DNA-binding transcriptional regulator [Aggregatibacter kilianii]|uniref:LacI family DNA-binding transcriptional regulator n=1 Tax=Aggregatibacter kilianii TaxID=2025884 RepID=UPI000D650D40|nr:LacI family DNA-binding transcriptional regulator [Aggregatibacter kilianii]
MVSTNARSRRTTGKVTLEDVAKRVGVGKMTVSRALRTPEIVSEKVRLKIEEAIRELGYIPNAAARDLASATSRNVVIVTSSISSKENILILSALQKQLRTLDVQVMILMSDDKYWLRELMKQSPQAIVLLNFQCPEEEAQWIQNSGILCIEVGVKQKKPLGLNIGVDCRLAMQQLIGFLAEKGYSEIALLSARQNSAIFQQYLDSWHTALLAQGLSSHLMLHSADEISFTTGTQLLSEALSAWGKIDAFVFLSDELACGAIYEALRHHLIIPRDIAVAGLGDLEVGAVSYPRLTTIHIPYRELGETAGKKLVELLQSEDEGKDTKFIQLPTHLVVRNSV